MKISWLTNAPWANVGYGVIMRNLLPEINKSHPCSLITNYGLDTGQKIEGLWKGITFYGKGHGGFEEALVPNHVRDFEADCLITVIDTWAFPKLHIELAQNRIPWVAYVFVDTEDLNPIYKQTLGYAFRLIPASKHTEKLLMKYFPDKTLPCIPCGVDTEIFKPVWKTSEEKNKLKRLLGFDENTFLISLMGDIKSFRKRWAENLEGIKIFRDRNPNIKTGVYIHTNLRLISGLDFDVNKLIEIFGLSDCTRTVDTYPYVKGTSDNDMAKCYNCSDVFLQASYGEGFSLGNIESSACGVFSIGTNFTSLPQVISKCKTGYLVDSIFNAFDQSLARKALPDPNQIADLLELIYFKTRDKSMNYITLRKMRDDCVEFAKQFDWKTKVIPMWMNTLKKIEKDIEYESFKIPSPAKHLQEKADRIIEIK